VFQPFNPRPNHFPINKFQNQSSNWRSDFWIHRAALFVAFASQIQSFHQNPFKSDMIWLASNQVSYRNWNENQVTWGLKKEKEGKRKKKGEKISKNRRKYARKRKENHNLLDGSFNFERIRLDLEESQKGSKQFSLTISRSIFYCRDPKNPFECQRIRSVRIQRVNP